MFAKPKGPPAQKLHTVRRKPRQKDDNQPPLRLDRVLGLTGTRPSALALNPDPDNPLLVYPAGGTIVKYNYRKNKQVGFLCPANTDSDRLGGQSTSYTASRRTGGASNAVKAAACVAYSPDGEYLAVGESGHQPKIIIWKGTTIFSELVGHKYGILAIAFSPDAKYLVSVGFQHDGFAYVWNWRTGQRIAYGRLNTKINSVAFDPKGAFFVTAGTNHIKFWDMDPTKLAAGAKSAKPGNVVLDGILGHMTEHQNSHFVDVACATAPDGDTYTYCVTAEGILMCFNGEWGMERWVDLKVQAGKTITVSETLVICGCTDGIMRVFEQRTLAYVSTLPKPHPIDVELQTSRHARTNAIYPDVEAIAIDTLSTKIFVVYNDHSLFIWDVTDLKHVGKYRSFLWHSDAVWGVELIPSHGSPNRASILPPNAFATHSSDGTVRFWDLGNSNYHNTAGSVSETTDAVSPGGGDPGGSDSSRHNIYSKELIRILYVDRAGILKLKTPQSQPETYSAIDKTGVRALRVTPDGQFLASGDRLGNIRIHELVHFQQLKFLEAHEAEILTIDFAEDPSSDSYLMATASRDRLIHIFDGGRDFELLQTLDDHTSSITSVKFCDSGRRLMSCGADKSVIFRVAEPGGDFHSYHNILGRSTVYDMDIDPLSKYVATASQDRKINVYSITTGKTVRSYRPDSDENGTTEGGFIKLSMDPSGLYMATSASDKTIRIFDFYTGTCVGKISSGHSELVTSVKFTADCQFLVSTAADGCIFVWRVAERMVTQMRSRLNRTSPTLKRSRSASSVAVPAALDNGSTTSMRSSWSSRPESIAPPFLMNESVLPAWARTSIASSTVSSEPVARFVPPKGRWAQRVGDDGVTLYSERSETDDGADHTDHDAPVARLFPHPDRRYTFEPDEVSFSTTAVAEIEHDAAVQKVTDVIATMGPPPPTPRKGTNVDDMVVQDVESVSQLTNRVDDDDEVTELDDGEEDLEEQIIFMPDAEEEGEAGGVYVAATQAAAIPAIGSIGSGQMETVATDPDEISAVSTESLQADQSFGNMTFDEYIQQPVTYSSDSQVRQSLSSRHRATQSTTPRTPAIISHKELVRTPEYDHAKALLFAEAGSLSKRKEATVQEVARVREQLAKMGIVWRGAGDPLPAMDDEVKSEEMSGKGEQEIPKVIPVESESSELLVKGKENVDQEQIPDEPPKDGGESIAIEEMEEKSHANRPSLEGNDDSYSSDTDHVSHQSNSSAYRARSLSPTRSAVHRDLIVESVRASSVERDPRLLGSEQGDKASGGEDLRLPDEIEEVADEEVSGDDQVGDIHPATEPTSQDLLEPPSEPLLNPTSPQSPSLVIPDLAQLRTLADQAAGAFITLAKSPPSTQSSSSASDTPIINPNLLQTLRETLIHLRDTSARALEGLSDKPSLNRPEASTAPPPPPQRDELLHALETYSELLVAVVRQKLMQ